jgi:sulfite reductase (NADPH) hemoprotein beta-component
MGRTPMIAPEVNPFVPKTAHLLCRGVPAGLQPLWPPRQQVQGADQDPGPRAGQVEEYRRQVAEEFAHLKTLGINPPREELERIAAHFTDPAYETGLSDDARPLGPGFRAVGRPQRRPHKQAGYAIVNISLKPIGGIPGDASAEQIELMADLAERYSFDELRVTHAQNIVLPMSARRICTRCGRRWTRTAWRRQPRSGSTTSSPAPASIIAASPMPARSRSRRRSRSGFRIERQGCRDRRAEAQDFGLHQRLRPPPRRPHRHPRRRPQGHGELPAAARRIGRGGCSLGTITGPGFDENGIVDAVEKATDLLFGAAHRGRALPRYLPPSWHGPVQGGDLWLIRLSSRRRLGSQGKLHNGARCKPALA